MSKVSVVLSTHNRASLLPRAIDSVLSQDFADIELIIIDDCSTDGTRDELSRFSNEARVTVIHNRENIGLPASLNKGIDASKGSLIARIDDDDVWLRADKIARQVGFLSSHPRHVLVGSAYIDEWDRTVMNPQSDHEIRRQMLFRCPFCHSSIVMRRSAFLVAGRYNEQLPYGEDWELWMRMGQEGSMANIEMVSLRKSQGDNTLSERYFTQQLTSAKQFVKQHGAQYPRTAQAQWFHSFNRQFFKWVPLNSGVHRFARRLYQALFGLRKDA